jgi:hypothetical protein
MKSTFCSVLVVATAGVSVLAEAAWFQLFADPPSRHGIGAVADAPHARAASPGPNRLLYPPVGGGAPDDGAAPAPMLNRFATLSAVRTVFVELAFWSALGALVLAAPAGAPNTQDAQDAQTEDGR